MKTLDNINLFDKEFIDSMNRMQKQKDESFEKFKQIFGISKYHYGESLDSAIMAQILLTHDKFNFIKKVTYHCYTQTYFGRQYLVSAINVYIGDYSEYYYYNQRVDSRSIDEILLIPNIALDLACNLEISESTEPTIERLKNMLNFELDKKDNEIDILENQIKQLKIDLFNAQKIRIDNTQSYYNKDNTPKKCYIMIDASTNYVKIGKSKNPAHRERTLQAEKPTIKMIHVFKNDIEKELHSKFNDRRLRGEWFNLSENEVNEIIKLYS